MASKATRSRPTQELCSVRAVELNGSAGCLLVSLRGNLSSGDLVDDLADLL